MGVGGLYDGFRGVMEMIGEGYLGKRVMKRCEEERRKSGNPVGSTDQVGSRT